ncbi:MAG: HAMP domain-containing histidine kinase [Spirochaetales bacterium]|nr:HAMP domain-containing histidine kinase [Spirochaetales bacterium]
MIKGKLTLSIKYIPITFVVLIGIIPLFFSQTIINKTIRTIIVDNTTKLTQGILDQSRNYLNHLLEDVEITIDGLIAEAAFPELLEEMIIEREKIASFQKMAGLVRSLEDFIVIDLTAKRSLTEPFPDLDKFLLSEQAALLLENPSRSLWMGRPPIGSGRKTDITLWLYKTLKYKGHHYVLAASIDRRLFEEMLSLFSSAAEAEVILISSDNQTIPENSGFFSYPFAAKALSRSLDSRYNIIYDYIESDKGTEKLMVQTYTDPAYLYNLVIITPEKTLFRGFDIIFRITTVILAFLSLVMFSSGLFLSYLIARQMNDFLDAAERIGAGQYRLVWKQHFIQLKEILRLNQAMQTLAGEVEVSRSSLESSVRERSEELQKTRQTLIHSEKMALMGRQSAKVAHEINNPLGVAVTASSHLSSVVSEIEKKFIANNLTRKDFTTLIETSRTVSETVNRNLRHATSMIIGFKNFASDQAKEDWAVISLDRYVKEIIDAFSYELKNRPYRIEYRGDENIEVETVPSIIYQTLTNLINNSLLHGFEGKDQGLISIHISKESDQIVILYSDDGKGISTENLSQIYKPFFTTKSGAGGTGLGLNIIKGLIEENLRGSILCESSPGEGVRFRIRFPANREVPLG